MSSSYYNLRFPKTAVSILMLAIISILTFEIKAQPIRYDSLREFNDRIIQSFLFDDENRLVIAGSGGNHGFTGSYFGIYDTTQANYQLLADTVYKDNICGAWNSIEDVILDPQGGYLYEKPGTIPLK